MSCGYLLMMVAGVLFLMVVVGLAMVWLPAAVRNSRSFELPPGVSFSGGSTAVAGGVCHYLWITSKRRQLSMRWVVSTCKRTHSVIQDASTHKQRRALRLQSSQLVCH